MKGKRTSYKQMEKYCWGGWGCSNTAQWFWTCM